MSSQLGSGVYEVNVLNRGGGSLAASVPWTTLNWSRVLDDTSSAHIEAAVTPDCCRALRSIRPWRHEVAIYRDRKEVWVGPILQLLFAPDKITVEARDLTAWWDHRLIHEDHSWPEPVDLSVIVEALSNDAMAPDVSPGLEIVASRCGIEATLTILAAQHQYAATLIRDLSSTGLDWTVIGRRVLAGGTTIPTEPIGTFVDEYFVQPPTPNLDGSEQANRWVVAGSGGGVAGDDVFASSVDGPASQLDGLLERSDNVSTVASYTQAQAAADSRVALTAATAVVENTVLRPSAPFPIDVLIPGALCRLALTRACLPVNQEVRLQSVTVAADASKETVTPVFQPLGTT